MKEIEKSYYAVLQTGFLCYKLVAAVSVQIGFDTAVKLILAVSPELKI